MRLAELFFLAVGLSMDAFAVAVCKGLALGRPSLRAGVTAGLWFGGSQALMPAAGYLLGSAFAGSITAIDHWIAFVLLAAIGGGMLHSAGEAEVDADAALGWRAMLPLALATSVDALAVGITFAFLSVDILPAAGLIGCTTALLSAAGVLAGCGFGARYRRRAQTAGGVILILLGVKILLEHLGAL